MVNQLAKNIIRLILSPFLDILRTSYWCKTSSFGNGFKALIILWEFTYLFFCGVSSVTILLQRKSERHFT